MSIEQTQLTETDGPLPSDEEVSDTVECGFCHREVFQGATIDVVAGEVISVQDEPEPHFGVAGVESDIPEVEQWCSTCSDQFDIGVSAGARNVIRSSKWVTPQVFTAALVAALVVFVVMSVMTI